MKIAKRTPAFLLIVLLGLHATPGHPGTYTELVMLHGAVQPTKISGVSGATFTLQDDNPDHAIYGIRSVERRDQPCWVMIRTENINKDTDDTGGATKDLCGGKANSSLLRVEFTDVGVDEHRIFVRGVRVCMNNAGTRVKGLQISGREIADDGRIVETVVIENPPSWVAGGGGFGGGGAKSLDKTQTQDMRSNCPWDGWKKWAECPHNFQIATGAILHFEAGNKPRALTGIALQCRYVGIFKPTILRANEATK